MLPDTLVICGTNMNIGDKVTNSFHKGDHSVGRIIESNGDGCYKVIGFRSDDTLEYRAGRWYSLAYINLINEVELQETTNKMDNGKVCDDEIPKKLSVMERISASADDKVLIKAGYMQGGEYTHKAKELAIVLFLKSQQPELVRIATEELADVQD